MSVSVGLMQGISADASGSAPFTTPGGKHKEQDDHNAEETWQEGYAGGIADRICPTLAYAQPIFSACLVTLIDKAYVRVLACFFQGKMCSARAFKNRSQRVCADL